MASSEALRTRLLELRQSFDRAFSEPPVERADDRIELLAIRVGRDPYAVRLSEIAALEADRTITPVPSEHPELLGIAGVKGAVVAVFDLATLLDAPRSESTRWLVLAKGAPLAFAFGGFDGQLALSPEALARGDSGGAGRVREVARGEGPARPLIDVAALVTMLDGRARPTR